MARRGKMYKPTEADRAFVERCMCAGDMTIQQIAECLHIHDDTLRKHFPYEILTARARLKGKAVGVLDQALNDGSLEAAKFVLARQAGWSEKVQNEITGKDGEAIKHEISADDAFGKLATALDDLAGGKAGGTRQAG